MALDQRNPNDPFRTDLADDNLRRSAQIEDDLQAEPQLSEGQLTGGRIAAFAVAIALALGAVYYGMNVSSNNPNAPATAAKTAPVTRDSAQNAPTPGVRDVTPYNTQPGTTTGAAPARPQTPPSPIGTDVDRAAPSATR
jgi:hypothetical protein